MQYRKVMGGLNSISQKRKLAFQIIISKELAVVSSEVWSFRIYKSFYFK